MSQKLYKKIKGGRILIQSYVGDLMGCGFLRIIFPHIVASQYRKDNVSFEAYYNSYFVRDHQFYKPFTAVQFQRAATKAHVDVIKDFRKNFRNQTKTAIYYEIDDLLMDINKWNYAHDYYKELKPYIIECMKLSDGLIVSTDKLKEVYSEFNSNITISPNHLPKFMWGDIKPKHERFNEKEKVKILYHGSDNHFATKHLIEKGINGGDFDPKLINFIKKTVDKYDWIFLGGFPAELEPVKNKIRHDRFCSIFQFPFKLKSYNADIGIAPLFPCIFNQSKSNIKLLEYTAVGVPAVCQDIDPYKKAAIKESDPEAFIGQIERLAEDVDVRRKTYKKQKELMGSSVFWESGNNIKNYINSFLNLSGFTLP
jgi:hypothetical protein